MSLVRSRGGAQWDYIYPSSQFPAGSFGSASGAVWPAADRGYWFRFRVARPTSAIGILMPNGGALTDNLKCGLYSSDGVTLTQRAMSAATAASGANAPQAILFASPYLVAPGSDYYAFAACNGTTYVAIRSTIGGAYTLTSRAAYREASMYTTPATSILISDMDGGGDYFVSLAVITTG